MYSGYPKADRIKIRTSLAAAWVFAGIAGFASIFLTPNTLTQEIGHYLPMVSGVLVLISAGAAAYGVIKNQYPIELVAAWFASAGVLVYASTVWYLVFASTPTRLQQACNITALMCFFLYRVASCSAHARKQRRIHQLVESGQVDLPDA